MTPEIWIKDDADAEENLPSWWDREAIESGDLAFVVLHKPYRIGTNSRHLPDGYREEHDLPKNETILFHPGEALPNGFITPTIWRAHGDRMAVMDTDSGERLDRPALSERRGEISSDGVGQWRLDQNMNHREQTVFVCGECEKTFESRAALHGHQSVHAREAVAEAVEADEGGDTVLTTEVVDEADKAELFDLADEYGLGEKDYAEDRLRAELRSIAVETGKS